MNQQAKEMAKLAWKALDDKKGNEIRVIDIEKVSSIADYFIIANGDNRNQVQAMSDNVEEMLGRAGYEPKQIEGYQNANWILLDYGDIVVHIFSADDRRFFDLERIWRDGITVSEEELGIEKQ
ncbi:MAG: ribosome silencing factor [Lachnospiraceae bacterium]|nr:ribosome silencing factor [Cuneatibacter sp.]MDD6456253.1 ribosome silencing factor [Lachnospiraceae bacterium]